MTTVRLIAARVVAACDAWQAERDKWRQGMREDAIKQVMSRLLFRAGTREQAEKIVDRWNGQFPPDWQWKGGWTDARVGDMRKGAAAAMKHGDGFITVGPGEAEIIEGHLTAKEGEML